MADLLAKRKAEAMLSNSSKSSSSTPVAQASAGKMSVLKEKMEMNSKKIKIEPGTSPVKFNSPSNLANKTIKVEFTEHFVEEDNGDQTVVAATVVNIFGLKDQITGKAALEPNGDVFAWPGKMMYINTVQGLIRAHGIEATADFMKDDNNRPVILFSSLSEVTTPLLNFHESIEFLKEYVQGKNDETSNTNPKKTFDILLKRKQLSDSDMDGLIILSETIYRK